MLRHFTIAFTLFFSAGFGFLYAEDAPKRSAELQALDRFIGEWESVGIAKGLTGKEEKSALHESYKWSQHGNFLLCEAYDAAKKIEAHFIITYDLELKQYRSWAISEGSILALSGTWDEATQTLTWKSKEYPLEAVNRFTDKDHIETTITSTDRDGKVTQEVTAKKTRLKK